MIDATEVLRDLVSRPSVNPMGRDLPDDILLEHRVTDYLEEFFRTHDAPFQRQTVAPGRDNIVARFESSSANSTILWEVHQDTVPIDHMTIEPFGARIENGKLFGRGACDVKGGMASMLTAFARLIREKPSNAANVVMACTVDEEHTFAGVRALVKSGIQADAAVIAEPTGLNIVHAHKGVARWLVHTNGVACHSSTPRQGVNAIYGMGHVLTRIEQYAEQLHNSACDPLLGTATISVGRIQGGTSVNTVPENCRIEVDRRLVPGEDPQQAFQHFADFLKTDDDASIVCDPPWMAMPALGPGENGALVKRLGAVIDGVVGSHRVDAVPYGTDASTIAKAGIPSVVFGPGDITKAHTKDEFVPLDELLKASEILYQFALRANEKP